MTAIVATSCGSWTALLEQHIAIADTSQTSLAHRMGVPESTVRGWIRENRSPSLDWVIQNPHQVPDELMQSLLRVLSGPRFVVSRADPESAGEGHSVMPHVLDLHAHCLEVMKAVCEAEKDHVWTVTEAEAVGRLIFDGIRCMNRITLTAARAACGSVRRRMRFGGRR